MEYILKRESASFAESVSVAVSFSGFIIKSVKYSETVLLIILIFDHEPKWTKKRVIIVIFKMSPNRNAPNNKHIYRFTLAEDLDALVRFAVKLKTL